MLNYFVRYRDILKLKLFVLPTCIFTPVLGLENQIQAKADRAFNERLHARLNQ